jgi:hypothetical protein
MVESWGGADGAMFFFIAVADSAKNSLALSATAIKNFN